MSEDSSCGTSDFCNISPEKAGAAALAQSVAISVQDEVDVRRNQNIIKSTVIASAYAKWLANPVMKDEYSAIIDDAQVEIKPLKLPSAD